MTDKDTSARDIDVLIIGAGINGAGLFRDLCLQGITTMIVDKADFSAGTSAAPSRLIHGGLKYIETGEFALVAQSTLERNLLLRNAPHTVTPLQTVIPIFSWVRGVGAAVRTLFGSRTAPRSRGAVLVGIGLWIYDIYGARARAMPWHRMWGRGRALREVPGLTDRIVAAGTYYDAHISRPERLVWELVSDGLGADTRAQAFTWTALTDCRDGLVTFAQECGPNVTVRPRIVVNAAGPWIDTVNESLGAPSRLIGGTRGSHILLRNDALVRALAGRMIYFESDDGRICLVFDHFGLALIGSTDIPANDPDTVRADEAEINYLLTSVQNLLPGIGVDRDQIAHVYSGIRPLPASDATSPGLISRDHAAPVADAMPGRPFPIISLVGGKWTTFRGFAEEVADDVLARLGRTRTVSTRNLAIGGGKEFPATVAARAIWLADAAGATGLTAERMDMLLTRYGTTARTVVAQGEGARLPDSDSYSVTELDWIVRNERVECLADLVLRRTTLAIEGRLTMRDLELAADIVATALGWAPERRAHDLSALCRDLVTRHRMTL